MYTVRKKKNETVIIIVIIIVFSQCPDVENPMHMCDRVDLDRRFGSGFADGVRPARDLLVGRLAVLSERESVTTRDAQLQGAVGHRPVFDTAVHHDLGLFRYWVRPVGFLGTGKRAVPARLELDEEQKTSKWTVPFFIPKTKIMFVCRTFYLFIYSGASIVELLVIVEQLLQSII